MHKMKYNCKNCNFHWEGNSDTFEKVLIHEKTHIKKDWLMVICNKCYNEHHDQCMGKAGMFDCGCICFRKPVEFNSHPSQKIISN